MTYSFKAARILSRYHLKEGTKRFFGWLPFVLFLTSFGLFATIFFPAIGHRLANHLTHQPEEFTLSGQVLIRANDAPATPPTAANGARVEIGGFATTTDSAGSYRVQFWTPQRDSVTVVLRFRNTITIEMLQLPSTGNHWTRDWVLEDQ